MPGEIQLAQVQLGLNQLAVDAATWRFEQVFGFSHDVSAGAGPQVLHTANFPAQARVLAVIFFPTAGVGGGETLQLQTGTPTNLTPVLTPPGTTVHFYFANTTAQASTTKNGTVNLVKSNAATAGQLCVIWTLAAAEAAWAGSLKAAQVTIGAGTIGPANLHHSTIGPVWFSFHDTGAGGGAADDVQIFGGAAPVFPTKSALLFSLCNVTVIGAGAPKITPRDNITGLGNDLIAVQHAATGLQETGYIGVGGLTIAQSGSVYLQRTTAAASTGRGIVMLIWQPRP